MKTKLTDFNPSQEELQRMIDDLEAKRVPLNCNSMDPKIIFLNAKLKQVRMLIYELEMRDMIDEALHSSLEAVHNKYVELVANYKQDLHLVRKIVNLRKKLT